MQEEASPEVRWEHELQDVQGDEEEIWALLPVLTPEIHHFHFSPLVRRALQLMADHRMKGAPQSPSPQFL